MDLTRQRPHGAPNPADMTIGIDIQTSIGIATDEPAYGSSNHRANVSSAVAVDQPVRPVAHVNTAYSTAVYAGYTGGCAVWSLREGAAAQPALHRHSAKSSRGASLDIKHVEVA